MGQPRAKTGANLRPNRANIGQQQQPQQQHQQRPRQQQQQHQKKQRRPRQQQQHQQQQQEQRRQRHHHHHQQQQQPRAKTGANLRPNRANIGQQQQQPTTTTTTTTPEHGHGLHPTHTFHGSALAGARLSGVSLINPARGPLAVA